jgi:hypothetical protein
VLGWPEQLLPHTHCEQLYCYYSQVPTINFEFFLSKYGGHVNVNFRIGTTLRSESRCALRLRYVDLVVSVEVAF